MIKAIKLLKLRSFNYHTVEKNIKTNM